MDNDFHYSLNGVPPSLPPIDHLTCVGGSQAASALAPDEYHYHPYSMENRLTGFYREYPQHPYPISGENLRLHEYMSRTGELPTNGLHQSHYSPMVYPTNASPWQSFESAFQMSVLPGHMQPRVGKQKRARMSLQKRLLVNARERERMRVLNKAFEALRDALPCYIADGHMAKITTLRLAINYIRALTEVLNEEKTLDESKKELAESAKCMEDESNQSEKSGGSKSSYRTSLSTATERSDPQTTSVLCKAEKS